MFCRFCGKAIPDDSCFCPVCGQALCTEEAAPHAQAEAPQEEATRQWYYQTATEKGGPVTRAVIEEYIQSGRIGARSMVFADGMTSWREAAYTELAPLFGLEAPPKTAGGRRRGGNRHNQRQRHRFAGSGDSELLFRHAHIGRSGADFRRRWPF